MLPVKCYNRQRQHDQRKGADHIRRLETLKWKQEARHAGGNRGDQKCGRHFPKQFCIEHTEQCDQTQPYSNQADHHMNERKCWQ
jgi:hypothetical protein